MGATRRTLTRVLPYAALLAGGVLVGISLLAATELALRWLDVAPSARRHDPFGGFSHVVPMFVPAERTDGTHVYVVSPGRQIAATGRTQPSPHREFLAAKPAGTFRIVVLGDSSAAGVPYGVDYAFSTWLERRLAVELPSVRFEVVNAAMPGYASRRLLTIAEELVAHAPDLVIVYNGHNEFAERRFYAHLLDMDPRLFRLREWVVGTRLWGLLSPSGLQEMPAQNDARPRIALTALDNSGEMFAVLDRRADGEGYATPREREYGQLLYRFNLEAIVRTLRATGAEVMLVTQSQNFADWAPGASAHRPDLSARERDAWSLSVAAGDRLHEEGDCAGALDRYREALAVDDTFADLHFRVATCARTLGQLELARTHYRRASDLDQVPHGAPTAFNDIARDVARREGALLADADAALADASPNGLVGDDLFADWVHPNIRGQQIIAAAVADVARRSGVPAPAERWNVGTYVDPNPEVLYAANPALHLAEHFVRMGTCALAHRADCALKEMDAVIAAEPDNVNYKRSREELVRRVESWRK